MNEGMHGGDAPPAPAMDDAVGDRLAGWVRTEVALASKSLSAAGGRIHAGVHQARKSIRRTRAALMLAEAALGAGATIIGRELRHVNAALSALRDAHALVATLDRLAAKAAASGDALVLRRARRVAAARRAALARGQQHTATIRDARAALAMLGAGLSGLPWDRLTHAALVEALAATQHRIAVLREKAARSDRDEDWHRWRRWMRRQSQQRRACAAAGVDVPDTGFDKSLTEQLGAMQDLSLLIGHCGRGSIFVKPDRLLLRRYARRKLDRQRERIASVTQPE